MAKNKSTVYLGYEDEEITYKFASCLNSALNKIGGNPDWPNGDIKIPSCPLCGAVRPLIVQLYAPLDFSQFHRSLYIFACLNPLCSEDSNSWLCLRTQYLDVPGYNFESAIKIADTYSPNTITNIDGSACRGGKEGKRKNKIHKTKIHKISWCKGIDDWGNNKISLDPLEGMDTSSDDHDCDNDNDNDNDIGDINETLEENGNIIKNRDAKMILDLNEDIMKHSVVLQMNDEDDEEDSNSIENEIARDFHQIQISPSQQVDEDPNANCAAAATNISKDDGYNYAFSGDGTTAALCAEIEGSETDIVQVETPKIPERDLVAMLKHNNKSASMETLAKLSDITLKSYFIAVEMEIQSQTKEYDYYSGGALSAEHIRDLYQEYKKKDEINNQSPTDRKSTHQVAGDTDDQERYEKMLPAHGDVMFHHFVSALQKNPGHILRYSRDTLPLLIAPLKDGIPKCPNCNGETICEVQLLPTLIPKLKMKQSGEAAPIEYGNVLIFTCLKSCWDTPDKWRYERVLVQAENYSLSDNWL